MYLFVILTVANWVYKWSSKISWNYSSRRQA